MRCTYEKREEAVALLDLLMFVSEIESELGNIEEYEEIRKSVISEFYDICRNYNLDMTDIYSEHHLRVTIAEDTEKSILKKEEELRNGRTI